MTLAAHNLSLLRSEVTLLADINLAIDPGTITAVLGPNGAGKTSLLRALTGELTVNGRVTLQNTDIQDWPHAERAKCMAVLPQHSLLDFPFTAQEVVMLGRMPHDSGAAQDRAIVKAALSMVDCDYLAKREYTRLSGGEKQRVHFARVLAQIWEPMTSGDRFLLLDEPTASFDLAHQRMAVDIVRRLRQDGVGVMIILHDLNLAARCADQIVLMQCGHIYVSGAPADVLTAQTVRDVFQVDVEIDRHPYSDTPLVIV
ncbi:MAG: heme ABC transporter ATP-binding protein [Pseudomonadota bacterium]